MIKTFQEILKEHKIKPRTYLKEVNSYGKKWGYPKAEFCEDGKHKLQITDSTGKLIKFGSAINFDTFMIHLMGDKELAQKKMKSYLARTANIKGNWKDNKFSRNNLSRRILWMATD